MRTLRPSRAAVNVRRLVAVASLVSAVGAAAACSKSPPPAVPTSTLDAGADAGFGSVDAGAEAQDAAASGPPFFTNDAGSGAGPGTPSVAEQAVDSAVDLAILQASPKVAPKMEKEGQPGRATLVEGEHFSMMVNLMPNRCYTIVGLSPAGNVAQLDLKLYGPPLFNIEAGKSAPGDKNMPVIGKGSAALCPFLPVAVPYKIDATAKKGAGRIGIQVFARNK